MLKQRIKSIEVITAAVVIMILLAVSIPRFISAQDRALIVQVLHDFKALHAALEAYSTDHESPPPDFDGVHMNLGLRISPTIYTDGELFTYRLLTTPTAYIESIPEDPFILKQVDENGKGWRKETFYYEYGAQLISQNNYPDWVVISVGPSLIFNPSYFSMPHRHAIALAYHVSNGLNSWGSIYMSSLGISDPLR